MFVLEEHPLGPYREWALPDPARSYALGIDTAGGKTSNDRSACVVCDAATGAMVARWAGHVEPSPFGDICTAIGQRFAGPDGLGAFAVIEANNHGLTALERMRSNGYVNFYMRQEWDTVEKVWKPKIGFNTQESTRAILVGRVKSALARRSATIPCTDMLDECDTFVWVLNERGTATKADHLPGCNDDILIAHGLCQEGCYVLTTSGVVQGDLHGDRAEVPEGELEIWKKIHQDRERLARESARRRGDLDDEESDYVDGDEGDEDDVWEVVEAEGTDVRWMG